MATQTFTLEGQSYTVPHGTSMDELDEYIKGQKKGPSPEVAAAANPPKAPPMKMEESPLAPSARQPHYLTREESNRGNESALSGVMFGSGGATLAAAPAAIAAKGVGGYVAPIARGLAKSYLGSEAGGYIGGKFGPTARTAGRVIGGVAGAVAPDSLLEGAPWPISKLQVPPPTEIPSAGYDAPLGPPAPTAEENLARAVKEGRAAKLPVRMPKPGEPPSPADAALARNPAPIPPRATPPAWKTAAPVTAPETPTPTPTSPPVQKVPEPPWITRAAQKAQGGSEGTPAVESPATRPGTLRTAIPEERPTSTEEFLTNLVKKPIWTPEDSVDVRNAFGRDGLMRPGEGQTQYRARLMGMIRSSRAAQGMTDIESYPAPKRTR